MKVVLEFWDEVTLASGHVTSGLKRTEAVSGDTLDDIYAIFYDRNNELRYCNHAEWKFEDKAFLKGYEGFRERYHSVARFYKTAVVD